MKIFQKKIKYLIKHGLPVNPSSLDYYFGNGETLSNIVGKTVTKDNILLILGSLN